MVPGAMAKWFPIAASMWGIALGTFAYRYAMLPLEWSSSWRHILTGGAIGLAVGGHALWRQGRDGGAKRPAIAVLIALGLAGAAAAFGAAYLAFPTVDRAPIAKRALPGFDLALPSGTTVEDRGDYSSGKLILKDVAHARGVVVVQWEPSAPLEPAELKAVAQLLGAALGKANAEARLSTLPGPDGKPADTILFGDDDVSFVMSALPCGARLVLIATGGASDTLGLQKRVLASFVCRADPAQDANVGLTMPLVFDLPGWYAEVREPDQIQVTDGLTGTLTMRPVSGASANVPLDKLLAVSFEAAGVDVKIGATDGDRVRLTMTDAGDTVHGWGRIFACPRTSALVLGIALDEAGADALYQRVKTARCLRDGEPPQQWPDPPAGATPPADDAAPQPNP